MTETSYPFHKRSVISVGWQWPLKPGSEEFSEVKWAKWDILYHVFSIWIFYKWISCSQLYVNSSMLPIIREPHDCFHPWCDNHDLLIDIEFFWCFQKLLIIIWRICKYLDKFFAITCKEQLARSKLQMQQVYRPESRDIVVFEKAAWAERVILRAGETARLIPFTWHRDFVSLAKKNQVSETVLQNRRRWDPRNFYETHIFWKTFATPSWS